MIRAEVKAKNGHDVIVAIHINKRLGRSVINKIASVYSKTDDYGNNKIKNYVMKQISDGNLLDASTKKAPTWFTASGLQLPHAVQTIIDANNSISQTAKNSQENFAGGETMTNRQFSLKDDVEVSPKKTKELLDTIAYLKDQMKLTKDTKLLEGYRRKNMINGCKRIGGFNMAKIQENSLEEKMLINLVVEIGKMIPMEESNQVLIEILLDTEEKLKMFQEWIETKKNGGNLDTNETEIMNIVSKISRTK